MKNTAILMVKEHPITFVFSIAGFTLLMVGILEIGETKKDTKERSAYFATIIIGLVAFISAFIPLLLKISAKNTQN
jgi:uncharacterized membrane protein